jgi:hypothetical protein
MRTTEVVIHCEPMYVCFRDAVLEIAFIRFFLITACHSFRISMTFHCVGVNLSDIEVTGRLLLWFLHQEIWVTGRLPLWFLHQDLTKNMFVFTDTTDHKHIHRPILNVLHAGLTQPARAGYELTTFRVLSESTTTKLPQPVLPDSNDGKCFQPHSPRKSV